MIYNSKVANLTFVGPCIVKYFYSKINQMYNTLKFILFWNNPLHVLDGLSVHHQESKTYIQHQVYVVQVLWLLASKQPQNLYDIYLMMYVPS